MTLQKTNNNIIEDLVESEGNVSPDVDPRRMITAMFNELRGQIKTTQ
jgi:hypothetical protein